MASVPDLAASVLKPAIRSAVVNVSQVPRSSSTTSTDRRCLPASVTIVWEMLSVSAADEMRSGRMASWHFWRRLNSTTVTDFTFFRRYLRMIFQRIALSVAILYHGPSSGFIELSLQPVSRARRRTKALCRWLQAMTMKFRLPAVEEMPKRASILVETGDAIHDR